MILVQWTGEKRKRVLQEVEKWIVKYGAYSGEHLFQNDNCQIESPVLVADIVDIIKPILYEEEDIKKILKSEYIYSTKKAFYSHLTSPLGESLVTTSDRVKLEEMCKSGPSILIKEDDEYFYYI